MKCGSVAILPNSPAQLARVSVMTPSVFVPAFSSSCAIAFSSTPVIRNENPDRFMAARCGWSASASSLYVDRASASAAADDHAARVATKLPHRHALAQQRLVHVDLHDRIRLGFPVPALLPLGQRRHG